MATIAIVHGLWHDAHAWFDCARQLRVFGHTVHLIPIAGHGKRPKGDVLHQQCVASICDYARICQFCDVTFVGHSCGAAWLLEAVSRMPPGVVQRIVLDSPLLPAEAGQPLIASLPSDLREIFETGIPPSEGESCVTLPPDLFRLSFCRGLSDAFCDHFQRHFLRPQPRLPFAGSADFSRLPIAEIPITVMNPLEWPSRGEKVMETVADGIRRSLGASVDFPIDIVSNAGGGLSFLSRPKEYARLMLAAGERVPQRRSTAISDPSRVWMGWQSFGESVPSGESPSKTKRALDVSS